MRLRRAGQAFVDVGPAEALPTWSDKPFIRHLSEQPYEVAKRERQRQSSLARKYGITVGELIALQESHAGACGLCGESGDLQVDHDHKTGRVRGLLCRRCNLLLGHYERDPETFQRLAGRFPLYLTRNSPTDSDGRNKETWLGHDDRSSRNGRSPGE